MPLRTDSDLQLQRSGKGALPGIVLLAGLLAACSGGPGTPTDTAPARSAVQGSVTKGATVGASVGFFQFDSAGMPVGDPVATTTTDTAGNFTTPASLEPGLNYLVIACGGIFKDESDDAGLRTITLASSQCLESILPAGASSVAITPYTQAMVDKIRREAVDNSFASLLGSNRGIFADAFGFDVLTTLPADPLNPGGSPAQIAYAMTVGGAAVAMNGIAIDVGLPQMNYPILRAFARDLGDGRLDGMAAGVPLQANGRAIPDLDINARIRVFRNNLFGRFEGAPLAFIDEDILATPGTAEIINQAPLALDDAYAVASGDTLDVAAPGVLDNDTDPDGQALTAELVSGPAAGELAFREDGSFTYIPDAGSDGTDTFTYQASDGAARSPVATVSIEVSGLPRISISNAQVNEGDEGVSELSLPVDLSFAASGVSVAFTTGDGTATTADNDYVAQSGTLTFLEGETRATIALQIVGDTAIEADETFSVQLSDAQNAVIERNRADITIINDDVNAAPTAVDDALTVEQDADPVAIDVLANDADPDGDTLSILSVGTPSAGGSASIDAGFISYQPAAGFTGTETFTYTIGDGQGGVDSATVTVTVQEPASPTAPVAVDDSITIPENAGPTTILVLENDSDPNGDPLQILNVGEPSEGGSVSVNFGRTEIEYTQRTPGITQETFTYTITDGNETDTATVTVNIQSAKLGILSAPNKGVSVAADGGAVLIDPPVDGRLLAVTRPRHGSARVLEGRIEYLPQPGFSGTDAFAYTLEHEAGGLSSGIMRVTVSATGN